MLYKMMVLLWYTVVYMMSSYQSANLSQLLEQVYSILRKLNIKYFLYVTFIFFIIIF